MAHVGRFYKLQFRRDLANVSNNRDGWPEAAVYGMTNISGVVGDDMRAHPPLCINLLRNSQPPMTWESNVRSVSGIPYVVRLSIDEPFDLSKALMTASVFDAVSLANYLSWQSTSPGLGGSPSFMPGTQVGGYTDSPQVRVIAGSFLWSFRAAGWTVYNP